MRGLAQGVARRGYRSAVAAPADVSSTYEYDGLQVYRYGTQRHQTIAHAYGRTDEVALTAFAAVLRKTQPAVVHFHARTAAVSSAMIDAAKHQGARTVLTYHTPTMSCARGTMMRYGSIPCDGYLEGQRCIACALEARHVPVTLARAVGRIPKRILCALAAFENLPSHASAVRAPGLILSAHDSFRKSLVACDSIVAVCNWVRDVLLSNGVPADKLFVSRQGIDAGLVRIPDRATTDRGLPRFAYFGRLDPTKGVDLIVEALRRQPQLKLQCDLFLVRQPGSEPAFSEVSAHCKTDRRLRVHDALPAAEVRQAMTSYDMVVVPSRWLETGPLVVLEAFAAGTPVLGADLGGIAELVQHDRSGYLFAPNDPLALAAAFAKICAQPENIARWRDSITAPRTVEAVVDDMTGIYDQLLCRGDQKFAPGSQTTGAKAGAVPS